MANLKNSLEKWKARKGYQKAGDLFFWVLLILLIIPGPRKFVATNLNKVILHLRHPSIANDPNAYKLESSDYLWDIRAMDGTHLSPDQLMGEVIFLNFWGTYCPPCIAEMPEIQRLYNDYGEKVRFILISGESPDKVHAFMDSRKLALPIYLGGKNMPEVFKVRSIPTTFIISKEGTIVTKKIGAADWDSRSTRKVFEELLSR